MGTAKDILLRPISAKEANDLVKRVHYSGKVVQNSQLHIGVFFHGKLEGAMQFGPSLDKRKIQGLVSGSLWHEFLELNRMAFTDVLPRNSESRALGVAMKLLRKHAPQVKWVVSFADGTQCGDGTIYRAAGFVLTGIKENTQSYEMPPGDKIRSLAIYDGKDYRWVALAKYAEKFTSIHTMFVQGGTRNSEIQKAIRDLYRELLGGRQSMTDFMGMIGAEAFSGFQLRYIYFIDPTYRARLTVPELPYSEIEKRGARMYKGERIIGERGEIDNAQQTNAETGGASPTRSLCELD
jgi:hypothetical protein